MQVETLIFHGPPEAFNEHIINRSAFPIHADSNIVLKQNARKLRASELTSLVAVEDFWLAISLQCFLESFYAEADIL